jgi:hypothetical protein
LQHADGEVISILADKNGHAASVLWQERWRTRPLAPRQPAPATKSARRIDEKNPDERKRALVR